MLPPVDKFFSESTVHSLVHFTGDRKLYIKLIWLAAFTVSFIFCGMRISDAVTKFYGREVSTTVKENAVDFEFPDLYICNENPISGSYSVSLADPNAQLLNQYRRLVNETVLKYVSPDDWLDEYAVRLINTLPYQFLSDFMGHQTWQSIIEFSINGVDSRRKVVLHNSNVYLNCFKLNMTDTDRASMSGPASRMQITLFADSQVSPPVDNSTQQDIIDGTNLKPGDWDFNYGYDYTRSIGFRIFFTPKGVLPTEWSSQIVLGGGQKLELEVTMEDAMLKPEDFVGQCIDVDSSVGVDYVNPYSGEKETFRYDQYACLHREVARMSKESLNCSILRQPMPWEFRNLPSCFNMTAVQNQSVTMSGFEALRKSISNYAVKNCRGKTPCRRRFYSFKQFSTSWPSELVYIQYLPILIRYNLVENPITSTVKYLPGFLYLIQNATTNQGREMLMQISLSAADEKCTETQLAVSYTLNSFIADAGGLLGLFLGMSLLSALELVELLHDCALTVYNRWSAQQRADAEKQVPPSKEQELDNVLASRMPDVVN